MEQDLLLGMVKEHGVLNGDLVVGRAATPILGRDALLPFNWGHLLSVFPFLTHICVVTSKRGIVGFWKNLKS